jgi:threonylcarbamoyladenosine tRNA methylthiotransferase MtaB
VRRLVRAGFREIVLAGIHLGHYGVEWNRGRAKSDWTRLSHLVRRIAAIDAHEMGGEFRVRLSSIEATEVTRELIDVMAEHPRRVCPHLHVSMQSGSDSVLRRMHRRWGSSRFVDRCRLVQDSLDQPALTTDIIVGFPGETDAEFEETCAVAEEVGFSKIHTFPFSARRGTPAAEMPDQIPPEVKADRVRRLGELETRLARRYRESLIGRQLDILIQSRGSHAGHVSGTACRFATVELPGTMDLESQIVPVIARSTDGTRLIGTMP